MASKTKIFFFLLRDYLIKEIRSEPEETSNNVIGVTVNAFSQALGGSRGGNNGLHKSKMGSRVKDSNDRGKIVEMCETQCTSTNSLV